MVSVLSRNEGVCDQVVGDDDACSPEHSSTVAMTFSFTSHHFLRLLNRMN